MATRGFQVLDLEALADHRGSLLGAEPDISQPSQKTFETRLWQALCRFDGARPVWVESESSKIGNLNCPSGLWRCIGSARSVQIDVPLDARISLLMEDYAFHMDDTATLLNAVTQLASLHGKEKIGQWRELIEEKKWQTFVSDLLRTHYDPAYERALKRHDRLAGPSHELADLSQASFDDLMDRFVSTYGL
jgi:tRNA 2-selenouridine synthase